jgi:hypothetical protein
MIDRLIEIGKRYEVEINVEKAEVMRISTLASPKQTMIEQKQLENLEYLNYWGSMMTNVATCTREIKSRITMVKAVLNKNKKKKAVFTSQLDLNLETKLMKCCLWSIDLHGAENWVLRKTEQRYLVSFEMWCWGRMEKISWADRVRIEVLQRIKEERNILQTVKRTKAKWIGHILRTSCFLKHVIDGTLKQG